MPKKYSKKVRAEAADMCAILATARANDVYVVVTEDLFYADVHKLALAAFTAADVLDQGRESLLAAYWAEAETMLREGWSPS